ncbi:hypothetical protein [Sinorhizobium meliloti]|uniref:hypothetical protein n=1 Tax=Rhizobium meliloti TaxID=382 RepID=UPI00399C254F
MMPANQRVRKGSLLHAQPQIEQSSCLQVCRCGHRQEVGDDDQVKGYERGGNDFLLIEDEEHLKVPDTSTSKNSCRATLSNGSLGRGRP